MHYDRLYTVLIMTSNKWSNTKTGDLEDNKSASFFHRAQLLLMHLVGVSKTLSEQSKRNLERTQKLSGRSAASHHVIYDASKAKRMQTMQESIYVKIRFIAKHMPLYSVPLCARYFLTEY